MSGRTGRGTAIFTKRRRGSLRNAHAGTYTGAGDRGPHPTSLPSETNSRKMKKSVVDSRRDPEYS